MALSRETRQLLTEIIEREVPNHRPAGEVDRPALTAAVQTVMRVDHPWAAAEIAAAAEAALYRQYVDAFFRHAKHPYAVIDRENREAEKQARFLRGHESFIDDAGVMHTKPRLAITKAEIPLVIRYREKLRDAHQREAVWWKGVYHQMELMGLADDAPISLVVEEKAA